MSAALSVGPQKDDGSQGALSLGERGDRDIARARTTQGAASRPAREHAGPIARRPSVRPVTSARIVTGSYTGQWHSQRTVPDHLSPYQPPPLSPRSTPPQSGGPPPIVWSILKWGGGNRVTHLPEAGCGNDLAAT